MAEVFLDTEKAFETTWHRGLLYILSETRLSASIMKHISSFLSNRTFRVSVEGELVQAGMPQGCVLAPTMYSLYINDTLQPQGAT